MKNLLGIKNIILADGAMGTYFSNLTGMPSSYCESANIHNPEIIIGIHKEYIKAGARLIRTNTFAANTVACEKSMDEVLKLISAGYRLASQAAKAMKSESASVKEVLIAADIGPIPYDDKSNDLILDEYKRIIDAFFDEGASLFIFETFPETCQINEMAKYIKEKKPESTVIASFAFTPDGYTRKGIYINSIIDDLSSDVDIFGLNCGCGPTHMDKLFNGVFEKLAGKNIAISCMPNAGYAYMENNRTIYRSSPEYFAEIVSSIGQKGAIIIGGCCGTTPEHIAMLHEFINNNEIKNISYRKIRETRHVTVARNNFSNKIQRNDFVILTELTPPSSSDISPLIEGAKAYKSHGVDVVTLSDSPLARVKMDSIIASAKIFREAGIETLPHLCCRDRNINSLRAAVIGAHTEGIRSILAVTGDAVPESERPYVKSVFNVSSAKLMHMIKEMNNNLFSGDEFIIGGALNPSVVNKSSEIKRSLQKIENGCSFFLTQPVFKTDDFSLTDEIRKHAKVFIGIMPIISYRNATYLKNEVPGFEIPDCIVSRFTPEMSKEEAVETGIEIALELAEKIRPHADGFYIVTPFNRHEIVCNLLSRLRERKII